MKKTIIILVAITATLAVLFIVYKLVGSITTEYLTDYPHYDSVNALSAKATDIVAGKVISVREEDIDISSNADSEDDELNPGGESGDTVLPYTVYTVELKEVYKGGYTAGAQAEIKQLKGNELDLSLTDEYVFFLESYEGNIPSSLLNPYQSVYVFDTGETAPLKSVDGQNSLTLNLSDLLELRN